MKVVEGIIAFLLFSCLLLSSNGQSNTVNCQCVLLARGTTDFKLDYFYNLKNLSNIAHLALYDTNPPPDCTVNLNSDDTVTTSTNLTVPLITLELKKNYYCYVWYGNIADCATGYGHGPFQCSDPYPLPPAAPVSPVDTTGPLSWTPLGIGLGVGAILLMLCIVIILVIVWKKKQQSESA